MTTETASKPSNHTTSELLAVMASRLLTDGQVVFAGVGIPLLAATLAQRLHGPGLTILFEGGTIGAFVEPGQLPPSTNEQRCTRRANMVLSSTDVLLLLQRGYIDIGFMGGAQIDQFGNLNSSFIGDPENDQPLRPEPAVEGFEVRHFFAAGRAPGGPEIQHHYFAPQIFQRPGLSAQVGQGEVGFIAMLVVGFELGHCRRELG